MGLGHYFYMHYCVAVPGHIASPKLRDFADKDIEVCLLGQGVSEEAIKQAIEISPNHPQMIEIFNKEETRHWGLIRNWNQINQLRNSLHKNPAPARIDDPPNDAEWESVKRFDNLKSPFHKPGIEAGERRTKDNPFVSVDRNKAIQMRTDMEKLGLINCHGLNLILVKHGIAPLLDNSKPEISMANALQSLQK